MLNPVTYALAECLAWGRRQFRNPTKRWPPCSITELTFELSTHSLCGVRIDAPLGEASAFGPADRLLGVPPWYDLLYFGLGLQVDQFEAGIVGFRILVDPESRSHRWERRCVPARLQVQMLDGSRQVLSRDTSEEAMLGVFGSPLETGPVCGDRVHTFRAGGALIGSHHEPKSGRLVELTICLAAGGIDYLLGCRMRVVMLGVRGSGLASGCARRAAAAGVPPGRSLIVWGTNDTITSLEVYDLGARRLLL